MSGKTTVPDMLTSLADIYEQRNEEYGNTYKDTGIMIQMFLGKDIQLNSSDDVTRFVNFAQMVGKLMRYSKQFANGGHRDSLDDLAVYAMMQQELDQESTNLGVMI